MRERLFLLFAAPLLLAGNSFGSTTQLFFRMPSGAGPNFLSASAPIESSDFNSKVPTCTIGCEVIANGAFDGDPCNDTYDSGPYAGAAVYKFFVPKSESWNKDAAVDESAIRYYAALASQGGSTQPMLRITYSYNNATKDVITELLGVPCSFCTVGDGCMLDATGVVTEFTKSTNNLTPSTSTISPVPLLGSLPGGSTVMVEVWSADGQEPAPLVGYGVLFSDATYQSYVDIPYSKANFSIWGSIVPQYLQHGTNTTFTYMLDNTDLNAPSIDELRITIPGGIRNTTLYFDSVNVLSVKTGGLPRSCTPYVTQATALAEGTIRVDFSDSPVTRGEIVTIEFSTDAPVSPIEEAKWSGRVSGSQGEFQLGEASTDALYSAVLPLPPAPTLTAVTPQDTFGVGKQLLVTWNGPSPAEAYAVTGYTIFRGTYVVATLSPPTGPTDYTSWKPTTNIYKQTVGLYHPEGGLQNGQEYCYTAKAVNPIGEGAPSAAVCGTPYVAPAAPASATALAADQQVDVTWDASTKGTFTVAGYEIFRSSCAGCPAPSSSLYTTTLVPTTSFSNDPVANSSLYTYQIRAYDLVGNRGQLSAPASAQPAVNPPPDLWASYDVALNLVTLTWSASGNNVWPLAGYNIYRATCVACTMNLIGPAPTVGVVTTYPDPGVPPARYYRYQVSALSLEPVEGPVTPEIAILTAPATPTQLSAVAVSGSAELGLRWNDTNPVGVVSGYHLFRGTASGSLSSTPFAILAPQGATVFQDVAVTDGKRYYFAVSSFYYLGALFAESLWSAEESAEVRPSAPSGLTAQVSNTVRLSWADLRPEQVVSQYNVYRSLDSPTAPTVLVGSSTTYAYTDAGVVPGWFYYYKVRAYNQGGEGPGVQTLGLMPFNPPDPPQNVKAVMFGSAQVTLSWTPSNPQQYPVSKYRIMRSSYSGGEEFLTYVDGASSTFYVDTSVLIGKTYFYVIRALDSNGQYSDLSGEASVTPALPPCAPSILTATASSGQVVLNWLSVDSALCAIPATFPVSGYKVYRSTSPGLGYVAVTSTVGIYSTSYTDTTVVDGTTYYYAIASYDQGGNESMSYFAPFGPAYSPEEEVTPRVLASAPTGLTILLKDPYEHNGLLLLEWTPATKGTLDVIGYNVYRSTCGACPETLIFVPPGDADFYLDLSVANGTGYYYRVASVEKRGLEANWDAVSATPYAEPRPSGTVFVISEGDGQVGLGWAPAVATTFPISSYQVYRATYSGVAGLQPAGAAGPPTSATTFIDDNGGTGLTNGMMYFYHVATRDIYGHLSYLGHVSYSHPEVSGTPFAVPGVPANLTLLAGNDLMTVSWSASTSGTYGVGGYFVYRATFADMGCPGPQVADVTGGLVQFLDAGVTNAIGYYYRAAAYDTLSASNLSPCSGTQYETPSVLAESPPGAPSNLSALATAGQVDLAWTPAVETTYTISAYSIYRTTCVPNPASLGERVKEIWDGVSSSLYADTTITNGIVYYYRVKARDSRIPVPLRSGPSAEQFAFPCEVPVFLTAIAGNSLVDLAWLETSAGPGGLVVAGYDVFCSTEAAGLYELVTKTVGAQATVFVDTSVTRGVGVYYRVRARHTGNWTSGLSGTVYGIPIGPPSTPVLAGTSGDTVVSLGWTEAFSEVSGVWYDLYRADSVTFSSSILVDGQVPPAPSRIYADVAVTNGTVVYYRVVARDANGASTPSNDLTAMPLGTPQSLFAYPGQGRAQLAWTIPPVPSGISGFLIYRRSLTEAESMVGKAWNVAQASYTDTTVNNGILYYYRVRSTDDVAVPAYYSQYSNEDLVTPAIPPGAPSIDQIRAGSTTIFLSWSPGAVGTNPLSGFVVYRSSAGLQSAEIKRIYTTGSFTFTDTGLDNGITYYYQVGSFDTSLPSSYSGLSATSYAMPFDIPNAPALLTAQAGVGVLYVGWSEAGVQTTLPRKGFNVYRGVTAGGQGAIPIAYTTATYYVDTSVVNGTTYYYRVRTVDTGDHLSLMSASETYELPYDVPYKPLGVMPQAANRLVFVSWSPAVLDGTFPLSGYEVFRGTCAGACLTFVSYVASTVYTAYQDAGVTNASIYTYGVKAIDTKGNRSSAAISTISSQPLAALVNPPMNVVTVAATTTVDIAWTPADAGTGAGQLTAYRIYRSSCGTCTAQLTGTVWGVASTTYTDTTVAGGVQYTFTVRGLGMNGTESADYPGWTASSVTTTFAVPGAPPNVVAQGLMNAIGLAWGVAPDGVGFTVAQYRVQRGPPGGPFADVAMVAAGVLAWTDTGTGVGVQYQYRIRAEDSGGNPGSWQLSNTTAAISLEESFYLSHNAFKPMQGERVRAYYTLAQTSDVRARIYSISGLKVHEYEEKAVSPSPPGVSYEILGPDGASGWDGTAADGKYVASGVYVIYLETDTYKEMRKVIVLK